MSSSRFIRVACARRFGSFKLSPIYKVYLTNSRKAGLDMELIIRRTASRNTGDILRNFKSEVVSIDDIKSLDGSRRGCNRDIVFVTGNKYKVQELSSKLSSSKIKLSNTDLETREIQDPDPLNIVADKCLQAYRKIRELPDTNSNNRIVLVEDVCLEFAALKGLPGPYIKDFTETIGPEGLYKMLIGFEDKSARAVCTYALMEDEDNIVFCRGIVQGIITKPRGKSWGWDPCFQETSTSLTFAEMTPEVKNNLSHRARAIEVLKTYLGV